MNLRVSISLLSTVTLMGAWACGGGPAQLRATGEQEEVAMADGRLPGPIQPGDGAVDPALTAKQGRVVADNVDHDEPEDASDATPVGDELRPVRTEGIGAIGPHVWIKPKPQHEGVALGKVRLGTSLPLRNQEPVKGGGCARGWYAVQPRGYVCLNERTTLDLQDRYYRALHDLAPQPGELFPYSYAYSREAPMYSRVPTPAEWKKAERAYGPPGKFIKLGEWAAGHEELLVDAPIAANGAAPWFFAGGKRHVRGGAYSVANLVWKRIPNGSMLSYARAFEMHGRVWLVTPELMLVPADRVQGLRRSEFHGVSLDDDVKLPLAWNRRHTPEPLYQRDGNGWKVSDKTLAGKRWAPILGDRPRNPNHKGGYWELRDQPGHFLKGKNLTFSWPRKKLPRAIKPGEKWIDARISPGTLTAYEGLRPIYATLFSPGKGGQPVAGLDHTKYATTQTGYFRFEWKEQVATMSNEKGDPKVLWFSDVPNVQYVRAPLAMHVAYWHEDFGNPKSAECLNLSPRDGKWLFGFTDPPLPEGWGAVRPGGGNGRSTPIMINGF